MRAGIAIGLIAGLSLLGWTSEARAQDSILAELYGQGVHAFFSGQYQEAHASLTTAIEQGSLDPRCFYFRGMVYERLGRPDEASADFTKGAELENAATDRVYPVSRSLQRIQGGTRMEIERYRLQARLAAHTRDSKAKQARYEELKSEEPRVLRNADGPAPAKTEELLGEQPKAAPTDPFGATPGEPIPPAANLPPPAAEEDPFGATTEPGVAPAAPAADDPFGGAAPATPAPAADDPFGAPPATPAPAPADDPFGAPPAADDTTTNPFADDPAAPADNSTPAPAPTDDPFADPFK